MRMAERWLCIRFLAQPSMVLSARQATAAAHPGHSLAHGGAVFAVRFFSDQRPACAGFRWFGRVRVGLRDTPQVRPCRLAYSIHGVRRSRKPTRTRPRQLAGAQRTGSNTATAAAAAKHQPQASALLSLLRASRVFDGYQPTVWDGGVGVRGTVVRQGWRTRAYKDVLAACPANPHTPAQRGRGADIDAPKQQHHHAEELTPIISFQRSPGMV
jgi:hypothetical protein